MKTCAKFGAFIRRVTIRTKYRPKRPDYACSAQTRHYTAATHSLSDEVHQQIPSILGLTGTHADYNTFR